MLAAAAGLPRSRVEEVLELVELGGAANRRVKGYSLGMRQRLALAAALLGDPPILILDEPANGLDPPGMRWLRDMLRSEVSQGRTVLISSHVLAEIAQTVDDVVVIDKGKLIRAGTLEEVTGGDRGVRVRAADKASALAAELDRRGIAWQDAADGSLAVQGVQTREVGEAALAAGGGARGAARVAGLARRGLPRSHRGRGMTDLIRAEILKLRTTRTFVAMAGSAFALFMVVTILTLALSDVDTTPRRSRTCSPTAASSRCSAWCSARWG